MANDKQTVIYRAGNIGQAHLLKDLLDQHGVGALVLNEPLQGAAGEIPLGWVTAPQVVVRDADADRARELVIDFEQQLASQQPHSDEQQPDDDQDWREWPTCPDCEQRRQVVCPICESAGTSFPLADEIVVSEPLRDSRSGEVEDVSEMLLLCPTCDEPFPPQFYRRCTWCGHEFDQGAEAPLPPPQTLPRRVILMMIGLGVLAMGLYGYFWLVLRPG